VSQRLEAAEHEACNVMESAAHKKAAGRFVDDRRQTSERTVREEQENDLSCRAIAD
jgi:hypothetical protein